MQCKYLQAHHSTKGVPTKTPRPNVLAVDLWLFFKLQIIHYGYCYSDPMNPDYFLHVTCLANFNFFVALPVNFTFVRIPEFLLRLPKAIAQSVALIAQIARSEARMMGMQPSLMREMHLVKIQFGVFRFFTVLCCLTIMLLEGAILFIWGDFILKTQLVTSPSPSTSQ